MSPGIASCASMTAAAFVGMPPFITETTLGLGTKILEMACRQILTSGASVHGTVLFLMIRILAVKAMTGFDISGGRGCRVRGDMVDKRYRGCGLGGQEWVSLWKGMGFLHL